MYGALPSPRGERRSPGEGASEPGEAPSEDDLKTPRHVCTVEFFRWIWRSRRSPLQATVWLSPVGFMVWVAWIATLFFTIDRMIPVEIISDTFAGMEHFANEVSFVRLDGTSGKLADVATLDDAVAYERELIRALLPDEQYGHERVPDDEEHYVLKVHKLLDRIIVAQRRVAPRNCAYPELQDIYPACYEDLSPETELTEDIDRPGDDWHHYDPILGAYVVSLPLYRDAAVGRFDKLMEERFWDRQTRQTSVRFAIHNAPGHYSGYGLVVFHLSPYGLVSHEVVLEFLRLQPYAPEVNGNELFWAQVTSAGILIVLAIMFVVNAFRQPHPRWTIAYMLRPWAFGDYLVFILAQGVVTRWFLYLDSPYRSNLQKVGSGETDNFRAIAELSGIFKNVNFALAMLLLFSTLRLIEFMVLVRQLRHTYVAVGNAMVEIGWFGIMFFILFGGFVLSGHVLFGAKHPFFKDIGTTTSNLMLWLLTLGGGQYRVLELPGGWIYLPLFLFVCLVLIFNILLALLIGSFDRTQDELQADLQQTNWGVRPTNHKIADAICDALGISVYAKDPYRTPPDVKKTPVETDPLMA